MWSGEQPAADPDSKLEVEDGGGDEITKRIRQQLNEKIAEAVGWCSRLAPLRNKYFNSDRVIG